MWGSAYGSHQWRVGFDQGGSICTLRVQRDCNGSNFLQNHSCPLALKFTNITVGTSSSANGLFWTCQDMQADASHPSNPVGRQKDSNLSLNFFKTDATTKPWFLAPTSK